MISATIATIVLASGPSAKEAIEKAEAVYKACKSIDVIYTFKEQRRTHRVHVLIVKNAGWATEVLASELFPKGYWAYEKNGQTGYIVDPMGRKCKLHEISLAVDCYLVAGVSGLVDFSGTRRSSKKLDLSKAVFGPEKTWQGMPAVQITVQDFGMKFSYYLNSTYTRILGTKTSPLNKRDEMSTSFENQKLNSATETDLDAWIARAEKLVKPEMNKR